MSDDSVVWRPKGLHKGEPPPQVGHPRVVADDGSSILLPDRHSELLKAASDARAAKIPYRLNENMYGFGAYEGVKDLPTALITTMNVLRQVPMRNPVAAAIIRHRQNQCGNYHRLPRFPGDTGFRVGSRQKDKKPTAAAKKKMRQIEDVLLYGGVRTPHPRTGQLAVWDAEGSHRAMGIAKSARALVDDTLTLDAAAIRIQPGMNRSKYPIAFWDPHDAALVRYALPKDHGKDAIGGTAGTSQAGYIPEIRPDMKDCSFVTVSSDGQGIMGEYGYDEMAYLVRNPRTCEWVMGYGWSELEQLISVITGILYGVSYNTEFFDSNHVPAGILALPGSYDTPVLNDFRQQLRMMSGGPGQFWTLPIIGKGNVAGSMEYVPLRQGDNGGMYWKEWILFCSNVACALYGMDSSEINMTNFGASSNALGNSSPESRIDAAQENGKEPLLSSMAAFWDEAIVQAHEPDFIFEYTGLSDPDENMQMAKSQFRIGFLGSTPNMERAISDERPIMDPLDKALWKKVHEYVKGRLGEDADQDEIEEITVKLYEKAGGQLAQWPDAPVGTPGALQIWQIEHNLQAPPQVGAAMDPSAMQPQEGADPNAQDGQQAFPAPAPTQPGKPAPGPAGKPDEDTHIADVGSMLLRRQSGGNPAASAAPPMRKSLEPKVIEVVIRRH